MLRYRNLLAELIPPRGGYNTPQLTAQFVFKAALEFIPVISQNAFKAAQMDIFWATGRGRGGSRFFN